MWPLRAGRPLGSTPTSECTSEPGTMRARLGWSCPVACSCMRLSRHLLGGLGGTEKPCLAMVCCHPAM